MSRPSPIRDAVSALVAAGDRHDWSIEDIAAALERRGTPADFSSVFRAVTRLQADGVLRRVELGDGRARFEAAGTHHEHVRCESCGTVGEVPGCLVDVGRAGRLTGYHVTGHQLLFSGLCPDCRPGASR